MRELIAVTVCFALLAGGTLLAVEQFGDRELFVPPPDAVAEAFVRETITGRYVRAREYLADPESMTDDDVRALEQNIESWVGEATEVEAEVLSRTDDRALANVRVSSGKGSQSLSFTLVFDQEWKIAR